jgi:hypothetical protein
MEWDWDGMDRVGWDGMDELGWGDFKTWEGEGLHPPRVSKVSSWSSKKRRLCLLFTKVKQGFFESFTSSPPSWTRSMLSG